MWFLSLLERVSQLCYEDIFISWRGLKGLSLCDALWHESLVFINLISCHYWLGKALSEWTDRGITPFLPFFCFASVPCVKEEKTSFFPTNLFDGFIKPQELYSESLFKLRGRMLFWQEYEDSSLAYLHSVNPKKLSRLEASYHGELNNKENKQVRSKICFRF